MRTSKIKTTSKMKTKSKNYLKKLLMTPHLDRHNYAAPKPKCFQLSKPEIEFDVMKEMYAALSLHTGSEKTTF